jgi:hypothetical protein
MLLHENQEMFALFVSTGKRISLGRKLKNMCRKKIKRRKRCKTCGRISDAIWFTALMTEEWRWNGEGYNECSVRHGLITDREQPVLCPNCENVVGTGIDFGF